MIFDPYPLPALLPWVDLRGTSAALGRAINNRIKYPSVFHAAGNRRSNTTAPFTDGRFGSDSRGGVYYERSASFSMTLSTIGVLGTTFSGRTSDRYGDKYRVYFDNPNWSIQNATTTSYSMTIAGTAYSVAASSLETFFAGSTFSARANTSNPLFNSSYCGPSQYYPWNWQTSSAIMSALTSGADTASMKALAVYRPQQTAVTYVKPIGFFPSRPLQSTPELIAEERVDQLVSLSGKSYRKSYARRRIYECKIMLDASLSKDLGDRYYYNASVLWPQFLAACDAGVTLVVDRAWFSQFWRPQTALVCPDMPNMISGQLLDASSPRLQLRDGVPYAFEVTLQIADESGIDGAAFGGAV